MSHAAPGFPLTVIVLTRDEEANIGRCLDAVAWAGDAVVVDSCSRDATVARARAARPDVRVFERAFTDFGDQRNWALDHAAPRHPWVLFLDADEVCTPACAESIRRAVTQPEGRDGFYLAMRNLFLGRWLRRSALYPSWQLRLLRVGAVRYRKMGHGQQEVTDRPLGYLPEPCDHHPFSKGVAEWIARQNRYSTEEVAHLRALAAEPLRAGDLASRDPVVRRRCVKRFASRLPWLRLGVFFHLYVLRGGFLDGRAGFLFCLLRQAHEMHLLAKLADAGMARRGTVPDA